MITQEVSSQPAWAPVWDYPLLCFNSMFTKQLFYDYFGLPNVLILGMRCPGWVCKTQVARCTRLLWIGSLLFGQAYFIYYPVNWIKIQSLAWVYSVFWPWKDWSADTSYQVSIILWGIFSKQPADFFLKILWSYGPFELGQEASVPF